MQILKGIEKIEFLSAKYSNIYFIQIFKHFSESHFVKFILLTAIFKTRMLYFKIITA